MPFLALQSKGEANERNGVIFITSDPVCCPVHNERSATAKRVRSCFGERSVSCIQGSVTEVTDKPGV